MRKKLKFHILGLALLVAGISACDQASQEPADIISPDDKPIANFVSEFTGTAFAEGDTVSVSVTTTKPIDRSLTFSAQIVGGDADDSDIEVIPGIIAPYTTGEVIVQIVFLQDLKVEDTESIQLEIGLFSMADKYLVHEDTENPILDLTISNYESEILTILCDWDKEIVINSNETYHPEYTYTLQAGSHIDFDIEVYDEEFNLIAGAWTGDCPEVIEIDETTLANGTYTIMSFLWSNDFATWGDTAINFPETVQHTDVPVTNTFYQQGVFENIVSHQNPDYYTNTVDTGYADYNYGVYWGIVDYREIGYFKITNGVITVLEWDDTELGGAKINKEAIFDPKRYEHKF